ncbi:hypothetical protein [Streptomyces sp. URMC 123]|uniref:hypothetical protein n=1 Tax=Streptomyces sp. URMC 123 TaxID=3423403 RepID=UPI003F1C0354
MTFEKLLHARLTVSAAAGPGGRSEGDSGPTPETLEGVRQAIRTALGAASEADETVARALRGLVADHPYDFGSDNYASLKEYRETERYEGTRDADEALKLAGDGRSLGDAELTRLNTLLAANKDNPFFAERFCRATPTRTASRS